MQHKCFRCGTEFEGNFCPECGEKWQEEKICPECGATLPGNAKFCNNCGYSFAPKPATSAPPAPIAPVSNPVRTSDKNKQKAVLYVVCRYLPYAFISLLSVLLFLFYLAPVAVTPGGELFGETIPSESLGNVYAMISGEMIPSLAASAKATVILSALLAFTMLFIVFHLWVKRGTEGARPFCILGSVFLLAIFIIACVTIGIVGKEDGGMGMLAAGAAPILVIVFSAIYAIVSVAAIFVTKYIERENPDIKERYSQAALEQQERIKLEEQARRLQDYNSDDETEDDDEAGDKGPVAPKKIEKPEKPEKPKPIYRDTVPEDKREELMPEMVKHIKRKRTLAALLVLAYSSILGVSLDIRFLVPYTIGSTDELTMWTIIIGFPCIMLIFPICLLIWSRKSKIKGWRPEKIYRKGGLTFCLIISIPMMISMGPLMILPILILVTLEQRKKLVIKLCGYNSPNKNPDLVKQYEKDKAIFTEHKEELLGEYKRQKALYKENRRAWTLYRYQKARYNKGKPYETAKYPLAWCHVHKIALSAAAVGLAAVITLTCVFALRDTRFRADNLIEIGLGADEKRVTDVLGEPFEQKSLTWIYYSKNYTSIKEEMDELEEKSMNAESFEELGELAEKFDALGEELETLEYQSIVVTFSSDGTVVSLKLDAAAVGTKAEKKQVKECAISPTSYTLGSKTKVSYAISYEDGSYCTAYFSEYQLPTAKGSQTIEWSDAWGSYSATIRVS